MMILGEQIIDVLSTERRHCHCKRKGKYKGRRSQFNSDDIKEIRSRFAETSNKTDLAREYGISRGYLYELVKV